MATPAAGIAPFLLNLTKSRCSPQSSQAHITVDRSSEWHDRIFAITLSDSKNENPWTVGVGLFIDRVVDSVAHFKRSIIN